MAEQAPNSSGGDKSNPSRRRAPPTDPVVANTPVEEPGNENPDWSSDKATVSEPDRGSEKIASGDERRDDFLVSDALGVPTIVDNPTPLSSALGIPTIVDSPPSSDKGKEVSEGTQPTGLADPHSYVSERLGVPLLIRDKDVSPRLRATGPNKAAGEADEDYLPSKAINYPLLIDNPAPLSSALGIPTIVENPDGPGATYTDVEGREHPRGIISSNFFVSRWLGWPLLVDDPTPLSSALGIATLSNEKVAPRKGSPFFSALFSRPERGKSRAPEPGSDRPFGAGIASRQLGSPLRRPLMENAPPRSAAIKSHRSDWRLPGSKSPIRLQRNEIVAGVVAALVVIGPLLPWGR